MAGTIAQLQQANQQALAAAMQQALQAVVTDGTTKAESDALNQLMAQAGSLIPQQARVQREVFEAVSGLVRDNLSVMTEQQRQIRQLQEGLDQVRNILRYQ